MSPLCLLVEHDADKHALVTILNGRHYTSQLAKGMRTLQKCCSRTVRTLMLLREAARHIAAMKGHMDCVKLLLQVLCAGCVAHTELPISQL